MVYGKLHQLIEQFSWDFVVDYLRSNPDSQENGVREPHRDDLPLHMACERRAPDAVILELLHAYPDAAQCKGRGENLALHVAAHRNLSECVIEALIRQYPEALDTVNQAKVTPRNIGHCEMETFQAIRRPTACWHQLMLDEIREEEQASRIKQLHDSVDAALLQIQNLDSNMVDLTERLSVAQTRLDAVESFQQENDTAKTIKCLQDSLRDGLKSTANRLTTVEDDIQAAASREFMAKAASQAHQMDIIRMQEKTAESANRVQTRLEELGMMIA